jgi:hypothetical protein
MPLAAVRTGVRFVPLRDRDSGRNGEGFRKVGFARADDGPCAIIDGKPTKGPS